MLPHLADRPIALVRAPGGIGGELFSRNTPSERACPG
ncbi:MAG: hypothetical protein V4793_19675 [Paraburkholderia tropica]